MDCPGSGASGEVPSDEVASTVARVTVYAEGARVTRVAPVPDLATRPTELRLVGLPLALLDGTVSVRARGAVATGVRVALDAPGARAGEAPPDDAELDWARRRAAAADAEVGRLDRALADLSQLTPAPRAGPKCDWGAALSARLAVVDLRAAREAPLREGRRAAGREADDAHRDLAVLEDRAARASSARAARPHELRKTVLVALAPGAGGGPIRARAGVPRAGRALGAGLRGKARRRPPPD